ncbi:MAG: hypothetical protein RPS47_05930 [Colwellia sp.]|jgi:hypothetical protein
MHYKKYLYFSYEIPAGFKNPKKPHHSWDAIFIMGIAHDDASAEKISIDHFERDACLLICAEQMIGNGVRCWGYSGPDKETGIPSSIYKAIQNGTVLIFDQSGERVSLDEVFNSAYELSEVSHGTMSMFG